MVLPLDAVTLSWWGPWPIDGEMPAVTVIWVSLQVAVVTLLPSSVSWPVPLLVPNPVPDTVNPGDVPVVYGRDTAYSSGWRVAAVAAGSLTEHLSPICAWAPGSWMLTPTWVGAVSAGMMIPGHASKSAEIVR